MSVLLERREDEIKIIEEVVEIAAKNKEVMEVLLKKRGREVKITDKVVIAAIGNKEVVAALLEQGKDKVQITEEVIKEAAKNWQCGSEIIEFFFEHSPDSVRSSSDSFEQFSPTLFRARFDGRPIYLRSRR